MPQAYNHVIAASSENGVRAGTVTDMHRAIHSLPLALAGLLISCTPESDEGGSDPAPDAAAACGADIVLAAGQVRTVAGVIQGAPAGATWSWKGVPFAAPPVGELRYRPPQPPACREGVAQAVAYAPLCPQNVDGMVVGVEDCLHLNVWAPSVAATAARPVMVFIHGGGHQQGGAAQQLDNGKVLLDGERLAARSGAIVVTLNYRLGPLGFLAHPALSAEGPEKSGNYGMLDQIEGLRWVRDNIAEFGGDPSRVMVFGESAGAVSTCRLLASPLAKGLFAAATIESGACVARPLAQAESQGTQVAQAVGCTDAACLRTVSVQALMATVPDLESESVRQTYDGVIDGYALLAPPLEVIAAGNHNHVPVIIGTNTEEQGRAVPLTMTQTQYEAAVAAYAQSLGAPSATQALLANYPTTDYASPRAAMVALQTDIKFGCSARKALRALTAAQDEPVYQYVFAKIPDASGTTARTIGAYHGIELGYVFDLFGSQAGAKDQAVVAALAAAWGGLASGGDPNLGGGLPVMWRPYELAVEAHLRFGDTITAGVRYRIQQCEFLASIAP